MAAAIRLIAMDMDGTLLTPLGNMISPANMCALHRVSKLGIQLALVTGRLPDDAGFFALDAQLAMHILAINGSVRVDEPFGEIISARFIPEDAAWKVRRAIQKLNLRFSISSINQVTFSEMPRDVKQAKRSQGTYLDRRGSRIHIDLRGERLDALMTRANKFSVISDQAEKLALLRDDLSAHVADVDVTSSWYDNLEIIPRGVNKGSALRELAASLGIDLSQVMAIGDQDNDVPMICAAGYGVAMGNASERALRAAKYHTSSNAEDGVAQIIDRLILSRQ